MLKTVRLQGQANSRFDINLAEGRVSEDLLKKILTGDETIEVKQDFRVSETGNVAVEVAHERGTKLTGLSVTEAKWWGIILAGDEYKNEVIVLVETERLKRLVRAYGEDHSLSGRGGRSNFKLLPVERLFTPEQRIKRWERAWLQQDNKQ